MQMVSLFCSHYLYASINIYFINMRAKQLSVASVVIFPFYLSPVPLINLNNITEATMLLLVQNQE